MQMGITVQKQKEAHRDHGDGVGMLQDQGGGTALSPELILVCRASCDLDLALRVPAKGYNGDNRRAAIEMLGCKKNEPKYKMKILTSFVKNK